ncbi:MAG: hydroxyisourate hydrolase [Roseiflexaceae bacterium]
MSHRRPSISTHVLDTERGEPAAGVPVTLSRWEGSRLVRLCEAETDADGRIRDLLDGPLEPGGYQLIFDVAAYFRELDGDVPFLSRVTLDVEISDDTRHYHIPLLVSRYSCSSYRGS